MSKSDPGPLPSRWLNCPRKCTSLIAQSFLAFKTPLGTKFNEKVPEKCRFTPKMIFDFSKSIKKKIGLWIDLTNTSRFYDKGEIEEMDCKYMKIQCKGHGQAPSEDQIRVFIHTVKNFMKKKPLELIAVHCTHGFNRTGFLIVSFMVQEMDCSIEAALKEFNTKRPPGIYKQDYLTELFKLYGDVEDTPMAPARPDWCNEIEEEESDDDNPSATQDTSECSDRKQKKGKHNNMIKKDFMPGVKNVVPFEIQPRVSEIQKKAQKFCHWKSKGFPGSQPVSMNMNNLSLLKKPYRVSWKADGFRYMMLIDGEDEVYFLDRDNYVFKVHGLKFLHKSDLTHHLKDTLLDGEMVIDKQNGIETPRYLCYDIIAFENEDIGKAEFYPTRLNYISEEIINPRIRAMTKGLIRREKEPFGVRRKEFWDITMSRQLLGEKFARQLLHEPDGLIFQPSLEPYIAGTCDKVLKWKPGHMNSLDFLLKIDTESGVGIVRKKIGLLYVGQCSNPWDTIKLTKELKNYDNKIIECKFENNQWVFMRERTDKSFPNSQNTAMAVWESIKNPVTKEILLHYIDKKRFINDGSESGAPPTKMARTMSDQ